MIKVSVYYPNSDDGQFDMDYYLNHHIELLKDKLGSSCKRMEGEQGISGGAPGSDPMYLAVGHMYFDSVEDFQRSFGPHAKEFAADMPNYTNIKPQMQISEVKA